MYWIGQIHFLARGRDGTATKNDTNNWISAKPAQLCTKVGRLWTNKTITVFVTRFNGIRKPLQLWITPKFPTRVSRSPNKPRTTGSRRQAEQGRAPARGLSASPSHPSSSYRYLLPSSLALLSHGFRADFEPFSAGQRNRRKGWANLQSLLEGDRIFLLLIWTTSVSFCKSVPFSVILSVNVTLSNIFYCLSHVFHHCPSFAKYARCTAADYVLKKNLLHVEFWFAWTNVK